VDFQTFPGTIEYCLFYFASNDKDLYTSELVNSAKFINEKNHKRLYGNLGMRQCGT
jgi:hypothetical protein